MALAGAAVNESEPPFNLPEEERVKELLNAGTVTDGSRCALFLSCPEHWGDCVYSVEGYEAWLQEGRDKGLSLYGEMDDEG